MRLHTDPLDDDAREPFRHRGRGAVPALVMDGSRHTRRRGLRRQRGTRTEGDRRRVARLAIGVVLLAACVAFINVERARPATTTGAVAPSAAPAQLSVPIAIRGWQGGPDGVEPIVDVSISGGPELPLVLDTGSTGINVLARAVRTSHLSQSDASFSEAWGQGDVTHERVASASVTIDGLTTTTPIAIGVVKTFGCWHGARHCEAWDHAFHGAVGTLGVSLGTDPHVQNPLLHLPDPYGRAWSISLSGSTGTLVLGAAAPQHPSASFAVATGPAPAVTSALTLGTPLASEYGLPIVCWQVKLTGGQSCVPTTFDTGSTDAVLFSASGNAPDQVVDAGVPISGFQETAPAPFWTFTSGGLPSDDAALRNGSQLVLMDTGVAVFYSFTFTYDPIHSRMELSPATPASAEPAWRRGATAVCENAERQVEHATAARASGHSGEPLAVRARADAARLSAWGALSLQADEQLARLRPPAALAAIWRRAISGDEHGSRLMLQFARTLPRVGTTAGYLHALQQFDEQYRRAEGPWNAGMAKVKVTACS